MSMTSTRSLGGWNISCAFNCRMMWAKRVKSRMRHWRKLTCKCVVVKNLQISSWIGLQKIPTCNFAVVTHPLPPPIIASVAPDLSQEQLQRVSWKTSKLQSKPKQTTRISHMLLLHAGVTSNPSSRAAIRNTTHSWSWCPLQTMMGFFAEHLK